MLQRLATVKLFFLVCEESLERLLHLSSNDGNECYQINSFVHQLLAKRHDNHDFLQMHFNHSLADKSRTEEGPEGHQEVTARDASQIEQRVGNLKQQADVNLAMAWRN